jgi:hypothetical protein
LLALSLQAYNGHTRKEEGSLLFHEAGVNYYSWCIPFVSADNKKNYSLSLFLRKNQNPLARRVALSTRTRFSLRLLFLWYDEQ